MLEMNITITAAGLEAAIKGNRIDVLCASHELAEQFGVQYAEVYIANE